MFHFFHFCYNPWSFRFCIILLFRLRKGYIYQYIFRYIVIYFSICLLKESYTLCFSVLKLFRNLEAMSEYVVSSEKQQYTYPSEGIEDDNPEVYAIDPRLEGYEEDAQEDERYEGEDGKIYFKDSNGNWYTYEVEEGEEDVVVGVEDENQLTTEKQEEELSQPNSTQQWETAAQEEYESKDSALKNVTETLEYPPTKGTARTDEVGEALLSTLPTTLRVEGVPEPQDTRENRLQQLFWLSKVVLDVFFSKVFLIYLTVLLYSAGCLILMLNLEYSFASLFRLFSPPSSQSIMEPFGYLAIYLLFTHVAVNCICVFVDMVKNLWIQVPGDCMFWGISERAYKKKPPVWLYGVVILATLILPFFWSIIETAIESRSVVEVPQRFSNVAVLATLFLFLFFYLVFFCRALMYKWRAYVERNARDDFILKAKAYRRHPENMAKKAHWYHASTFLEEFGLDRDTLFYEIVVLTVGLIPILCIYAGQATAAFIGDPPVTWGLVASIGFSCVIALSWLSCLPSKGHWSAYFTFFLAIALLILGVVGAGSSCKPLSAILVIVLFALSQGLMTRKRAHQLTRKERQTLLNASADEPVFDARKWFPTSTPCRNIWFDPYLCCFKNAARTLCSCCSCCKKALKPRDPSVVLKEKEYARKKVALRTDHKYTLAWFIFLMVMVAFAVGLGNALQYDLSSSIAGKNSNAFTGKDTNNSICQLAFNSASSTPFSIVDLAFLGVLSYSYATTGDTDFVTWFSDFPQFYRVYPERLPPTFDYATTGISIPFSHYIDFSTGFHIITLNGNFRGLSIFRSIDDWGSVLALQAAKAISPLISMWPERYQETFVRVSGLYHDLFPPYKTLLNVTNYIQDIVSTGVQLENILVVGDEVNGGYSKFLAASTGVRYVAFNPPGTKYTLGSMDANGTQIIGSRSLWSLVDYLDTTGVSYFYSCPDTVSMNGCSNIMNTIQYLVDACGDPYGRYLLD